MSVSDIGMDEFYYLFNCQNPNTYNRFTFQAQDELGNVYSDYADWDVKPKCESADCGQPGSWPGSGDEH